MGSYSTFIQVLNDTGTETLYFAVGEANVGANISVAAGEQFSGLVATFRDAGGTSADDFSATIDWGDNTPASPGAIVQLPECPGGVDLICYEVHGAHTYGQQGTYSIVVTIQDGGDGKTRKAKATVKAGTPEPATAILGPSELVIGDLTRFIADSSARVTRHQWDLDGNGTYERDIGTNPAVDHAFDDDGRHTIGLRVTFAGGAQVTDNHVVVVERPPLLALESKPAIPKPGQKFKLSLNFAREQDTTFGVVSWDIAGVKPKKKQTFVKLAGKNPPVSVKTKGKQPTLTTALKTEIGKTGYFPVAVTVHDNKGGVYELNSGIAVANKIPDKPFALPKQTLDCDEKPPPGSGYMLLYLYSFCADIVVLGEPVEGGIINIQNASPDLSVCHDAKLLFLSQKDFDPTIFEKSFDPAGFTPKGQSVGGQAGAASRGAAGTAAQKECTVVNPSRVLEWSLGDGNAFNYTSDPGGPHVIQHSYSKPGTYKVSLLADVPYPPKGAEDVDDFDPEKTGFIRSRRTISLGVGELYCGPAFIHGIAAKPVPTSAFEAEGTPACFNKTQGPKGPEFTTLKGYGLDFGGLSVTGKKLDKFAQGQLGDFGPTPLVIDQNAATITPKPPDFKTTKATAGVVTQPSSVLVASPKLPGISAGSYAFRGPELAVPKPAFDSSFGAKVSKVGDFGGGAGGLKIGGLGAKTVQTFVAAGAGPFVRAWLALPPPLAGTPPIDLPPGGAQAASHWGVPTDFSIDLGKLSLGLFDLPGSFALEHKVAGGWIGGGDLSIPLLGSLGAKVNAPYKPSPTGEPPDKCTSITGPSGIALKPDGSFDFGGATATFSNQIPVGPAGIGCIAVRGQSVPFVMEGRVSGSFPKDGPLDINGCFLLGVLAKSEQATGCGFTRKAGGATMTWLRATGSLGVFDKFTLGDASFDFTTEGGGATALIAGHAQPSFGPIRVGLNASGAMIFPSLQFHLGANGKIWGFFEVPYPCPSLDDPFDICWEDIETPHFTLGAAMISSKGFGFCGGPLGVTFKKGGGVNVDLCDLSSLEVAAATASHDGTVHVQVPKGLPEVAFVLRSARNSPVVDVIDPEGEKFKDPLAKRWRVASGNYDLIHLNGQTVIFVDKPAPGPWHFEPHEDSPPVTSVSAHRVLSAPKIDGKVLGDGRIRILKFDADLEGGDRIRFVEVGPGSSQAVGASTGTFGRAGSSAVGSAKRSGRGRVRFGTGNGPARKRRILAVVERNGIPFDLIPIDSYKAPRPRPVPAPKRVRVKLKGGRLQVGWRPAKGAKRHEVVARLSDGRVLRAQPKSKSTRFGGVSARIGAKVTVTAIAGDGRESKPAKARKKPKGPQPVTIEL